MIRSHHQGPFDDTGLAQAIDRAILAVAEVMAIATIRGLRAVVRTLRNSRRAAFLTLAAGIGAALGHLMGMLALAGH